LSPSPLAEEQNLFYILFILLGISKGLP
jgi:hypothetical protein